MKYVLMENPVQSENETRWNSIGIAKIVCPKKSHNHANL